MEYHVKTNLRKSIRKIQNEPLTHLQSCICNNPQLVNSPLTNEHIDIKYHIKGKVIYIYNHSSTYKIIKKLINKNSTGGWVCGLRYWLFDVMIGHSSLRIYMPPQVKNIINHHKVMCGCEIFISAAISQSLLNSHISSQIVKLVSVS